MNSRNPFLNLPLFGNIIQRVSKNQREGCFSSKSHVFLTILFVGEEFHTYFILNFSDMNVACEKYGQDTFSAFSPAIFSVICHMEAALSRINLTHCRKSSLRIWSHLLKKSLMENFVCAVTYAGGVQKQLFLGV